MTTALDLVYQYRQLAGKCELDGLEFEEIELLQTLEALFADRAQTNREFLRERVNVRAKLKARGHVDEVTIDNLGPGGVECAHAPYLDTDDLVEIVINDDELCLSYRFKARVTWFVDSDHDARAGLRFVGTPVLLRYGSSAKGAAGEGDEPAVVAA